MSNGIVLVGGGGHCISVLDSLLDINRFSLIGIIDREEYKGQDILGVQIIGSDDDLPKLYSQGFQYAFITVGSIGDPRIRIRLSKMLDNIGFTIPNIVDPSARLSSHADLERGIFVGKNAVVNAGAKIKSHVIINTGAIIEHNCMIGEFAHIAPGAILGGAVKIGANTHIGANSTIRQQIVVGSDTVIGMGSVVVKDFEDHVTAYGNPCVKVG